MSESERTDLFSISLTFREMRRAMTSGRLVAALPSMPLPLSAEDVLHHDTNSRRRILERAALEHDMWLEFESELLLYPWN